MMQVASSVAASASSSRLGGPAPAPAFASASAAAPMAALAAAASPAAGSNNNHAVVQLKDFDVSQINFEPVTKNARNGKSVRITYGPSKVPIRIQLPELFIPFEMKQMPDDIHPGEFTYNFEAALNGYDEEDKADKVNLVRELYLKLKAFDKLVFDTCVARSPEWLGEAKKPEVVEEFHKRVLRHNNPKFSPLVRVKAMRLNANGDMPRVFDKANNNAPIDITTLSKGTRAKLIVTIPSVWLVNKNFGVSIKLFQACVTSRPMVNWQDYAFNDEEDAGTGAGGACRMDDDSNDF
jgi:hypothetical protein